MHSNRYFNPDKPISAEFGSLSLIGSWLNGGFVVGRYKRLTRKQSYENVILSAPTGAGKTTRFLVKQILSIKNASLIINDPQGELWHHTSGYLGKHFEVYSVNFSDSRKSAGYNPLSRIRKRNDINKLAELLMATTYDKGSGDVFWKMASINLTAILMRILFYQPVRYQNIFNLIRMLKIFSVDGRRVDEWVARTRDDALILDYKELIHTPEKTLLSVVATVKSALQLFDDPEIAKTSSVNTFDFSQLRERPTAVFLNNTLGDQRYLSILNSVFFDQFYAHVLDSLPGRDDLDIFLVIDEAGQLFIPTLAQATATARKVRVSTYLAVQSHSQLKSFYRDQAETIKANCRTKIWLTGQSSLDELREIETLGGKRIYRDEKGVERTVPLISADAIRMLPEDRSLILSGSHPLIMGRTSPFFRSPIYGPRAKIPPLPFTQHIPDGPLSLLK